MSSTSKTANLELSQFTGTDKPAWLTDYNNDMYKIDTAVKSVKDEVEEKENEIAELRDKDLELATSIADNTTRIADVELKQKNDETDIVVLKENYEQIHHEVVKLTTDIENGHIYSTDEKIVGKWFDGRNVYERTITDGQITLGTNDNRKTWSLNLPSDIEVISCKGYFLINNNERFVFLSNGMSSDSSSNIIPQFTSGILKNATESRAYVSFNSNIMHSEVTKIIITIEYVK